MTTPPSNPRTHFGRGGSGNTTSTHPIHHRRPSHFNDSLPASTPRRFSTGIGGHGNIAPPSSTESNTRALLDTSAPGLVLSSSPRTLYGIAGAGNVYKASESEIQSAKANNDGMRRASLATLEGRRGSKAATDVSDLSSAGEMSASPPSRRESLVASVRDFLERKGSKA